VGGEEKEEEGRKGKGKAKRRGGSAGGQTACQETRLGVAPLKQLRSLTASVP
jgi:hypothetical protein